MSPVKPNHLLPNLDLAPLPDLDTLSHPEKDALIMSLDARIIEAARFLSEQKLNTDLSDEELDVLEEFLSSATLEDRSMDLATLEGLLTAVVIGPDKVMPAHWMPWVWDMYEGRLGPEFANKDQAKQILDLLMRRYNAVVRQFLDDPAGFDPIFNFSGHWDAAEWCEGFLFGLRFGEASWGTLWIAHPSWLTPFVTLGTDEGMELLEQRGGNAMEVVDAIVPALVNIHTFWRGRHTGQAHGIVSSNFPMGGSGTRQPIHRDAPKVGRNDPCSCGSGKKYKKCCAANTSSVL